MQALYAAQVCGPSNPTHLTYVSDMTQYGREVRMPRHFVLTECPK